MPRDARGFILSLGPDVRWKHTKATIDFRGERWFCSLWPAKNPPTLWIAQDRSVSDPERKLQGIGRAANLKLIRIEDFQEAV